MRAGGRPKANRRRDVPQRLVHDAVLCRRRRRRRRSAI
jgi:hypothetical protein